MTQQDNGGPSFPTWGQDERAVIVPKGGMTLRDYFAGQAIVGIINACAMDTRQRGEATETMFARKAYSIADAMLAARKKTAGE